MALCQWEDSPFPGGFHCTGASLHAIAPFQSPVIESDVRVFRIRLSDETTMLALLAWSQTVNYRVYTTIGMIATHHRIVRCSR